MTSSPARMWGGSPSPRVPAGGRLLLPARPAVLPTLPGAMPQLVPSARRLSGGERRLRQNTNVLVWEDVAPVCSPFPLGLAKMLPGDGWARAHSTPLASPVLRRQQSPSPLQAWEPFPKMFGCIRFAVSTVLPTRRHLQRGGWGARGREGRGGAG